MQATLLEIPRSQQEIDIWSKANAVDHQDIFAGIARQSSVIQAIELVTGGTGYSSAPNVEIGPPDLPGGIQAVATAAFTSVNGSETVTFTLVNPGLGYSQAPAVTLSGGGGSGLTAQAVVNYLFLPLAQLDPIPFNQLDDWSNQHFITHEAMLNALGIQNTNLTTPDFNDPIAMQEYIFTHWQDHASATAALLGYLPNA
jgi:hypothetical protein